MDDGIEPVADGTVRELLRRKAMRIHAQSAAAAVVLTAVGLML